MHTGSGARGCGVEEQVEKYGVERDQSSPPVRKLQSGSPGESTDAFLDPHTVPSTPVGTTAFLNCWVLHLCRISCRVVVIAMRRLPQKHLL